MSVITDVTASLAGALDELRAINSLVLADGETVVALQRQLTRLEAIVTRAVAAFDARGQWEADGARSAASWIAARAKLPLAQARRRVRLGRDLRSMPAVEAAWRAGDINDSHVSVLVGARSRNPAAFAHDEEMLVGEAERLRYVPFVRALAYWVQLADPDGAEEQAAEAYARRRFHLSPGFDGEWFADGHFDPIGGSIFDRVLRRIYDEMFRADWADARAQAGEGVCAADLTRTPAQRRHDAAVEMARRAAAMPDGRRRPEPLFTVLVGYDKLQHIAELWNGTVVTPGQLVPWLGEGWVERVVFEGPSRVIDVGARRRFFSGATRRAIEVRDRVCSNEFCDVPAEECEIDHAKPFGEGGLTTSENGKPACGYHNRWKEKQRRRRGPPEEAA